EMRSAIVARIEIAETLAGEKRLVRIEALDLQKPGIRIGVRSDEGFPRIERQGLWTAVLRRHMAPIDPVLADHFGKLMPAADHRGYRRSIDLALPGIALLAAEE